MLWRPDFDAGFETWWRAYPRREGGKFSAEQAYQRALQRATPEELLAGLERYKAHLPATKYVLTPAKWLDRGCWLDEYDAAPEGKTVKPERQAYVPWSKRTTNEHGEPL